MKLFEHMHEWVKAHADKQRGRETALALAEHLSIMELRRTYIDHSEGNKAYDEGFLDFITEYVRHI